MNISVSSWVSRIASPLLLALAMTAGSAQALPVAGTVENDNRMFTVVHLGATPGGSGDRDEWLWFDDNQPLHAQLMGTDVSLSGPQSFSLTSNNGVGELLITRLELDLDDLTDGFFYGEMDYILTSSTNIGALGTFVFKNENYNSIFNTSSFDGENLEFFLWGGDERNELGIDFAFRGEIEVPVPGSALLMVIAIAALRSVRKSA